MAENRNKSRADDQKLYINFIAVVLPTYRRYIEDAASTTEVQGWGCHIQRRNALR